MKAVLNKNFHLGLVINFCFIYTENIKTLPEKEVERILNKIEKSKIDEVFILDEEISYNSLLDMIYKVSNKKIIFRISTNIFKLATGASNFNSIQEIPALDLSRSSPPKIYSLIKRTIDIIFGILFLIIFSPIILFISLMIKISSPGSIFIKQERVGYKGKKFTMYKFRTMKNSVELYQEAPMEENDNRVTSFGKILRKTSLDEIPQFINVIKGEMSLVGPRPEMSFIVKNYKSWQYKRLEAKPGITGLWQILGRKNIALSEHLEYDFYYINNQSILYDFVIIIKTIPVVLFGKGAY